MLSVMMCSVLFCIVDIGDVGVVVVVVVVAGVVVGSDVYVICNIVASNVVSVIVSVVVSVDALLLRFCTALRSVYVGDSTTGSLRQSCTRHLRCTCR
jgi:hypothetical protein